MSNGPPPACPDGTVDDAQLLFPQERASPLTQSSRDNKSQEIFVLGLGISLCLIPLASMAPANARGTRQSTKLQRLRREMTVRSRGPQSPRQGHAIQWHGPAVFDNL